MFQLDDMIIDRIVMGIAEDVNTREPLYILSQLSEATIEVTAEAKEVKDARGILVKKIYTGKSGTLTAQNAFCNTNIMAAGSGSKKEVASASAKIKMPRVLTVKKGTATLDVTGIVEGTITVSGLNASGALVKTYAGDTQAAADKYALSDTTLTLPKETAPEVAEFLVKYTVEVQDGIKVTNKADKFPDAVRLTLKAVGYELCDPKTVKSYIIEVPNFNPSPETSLALQTESTMDYKGDLAANYCSTDKELYTVYAADEE